MRRSLTMCVVVRVCSCLVSFPEQTGWSGQLAEMEPVLDLSSVDPAVVTGLLSLLPPEGRHAYEMYASCPVVAVFARSIDTLLRRFVVLLGLLL